MLGDTPVIELDESFNPKDPETYPEAGNELAFSSRTICIIMMHLSVRERARKYPELFTASGDPRPRWKAKGKPATVLGRDGKLKCLIYKEYFRLSNTEEDSKTGGAKASKVDNLSFDEKVLLGQRLPTITVDLLGFLEREYLMHNINLDFAGGNRPSEARKRGPDVAETGSKPKRPKAEHTQENQDPQSFEAEQLSQSNRLNILELGQKALEEPGNTVAGLPPRQLSKKSPNIDLESLLDRFETETAEQISRGKDAPESSRAQSKRSASFAPDAKGKPKQVFEYLSALARAENTTELLQTCLALSMQYNIAATEFQTANLERLEDTALRTWSCFDRCGTSFHQPSAPYERGANIMLAMAGTLAAANKTSQELQRKLHNRLADLLGADVMPAVMARLQGRTITLGMERYKEVMREKGWGTEEAAERLGNEILGKATDLEHELGFEV
ncbi:MAG: hypothetical protein Q9201_002329 [Fulgogasparrea decipioides]